MAEDNRHTVTEALRRLADQVEQLPATAKVDYVEDIAYKCVPDDDNPGHAKHVTGTRRVKITIATANARPTAAERRAVEAEQDALASPSPEDESISTRKP